MENMYIIAGMLCLIIFVDIVYAYSNTTFRLPAPTGNYTRRSWAVAKDHCISLNMQLAALKTDTDMSNAVHFLTNNYPHINSVWIGLKYSDVTKDFRWLDGSALTSNWTFSGDECGSLNKGANNTWLIQFDHCTRFFHKYLCQALNIATLTTKLTTALSSTTPKRTTTAKITHSTTTPTPISLYITQTTTSSSTTTTAPSNAADTTFRLPAATGNYTYTWAVAKDHCISLNMQLAALNTDTDMNNAVHFITNNYPHINSVWIGLKYSDVTKDFRWLDGSALTSNWAFSGDECGSLNKGANNTWLIQSDHCTHSVFKYLCQALNIATSTNKLTTASSSTTPSVKTTSKITTTTTTISSDIIPTTTSASTTTTAPKIAADIAVVNAVSTAEAHTFNSQIKGSAMVSGTTPPNAIHCDVTNSVLKCARKCMASTGCEAFYYDDVIYWK